jgi:hypothetical protein
MLRSRLSLLRCRRLVSTFVWTLLLLFSLDGRAEDELCRDRLRVVTARATFKTPMFKGQPTRRDAELDVELTSTATAPITTVELGVFLGASMRAIAETRPSSLPTARPRELEDGGVAFRAEVPVLIHPGTTRTVRFTKETLPLDKDIASVTAVVAGCRTARALAGEATIDPEAREDDGRAATIQVVAFALGLVAVIVILVRILR